MQNKLDSLWLKTDLFKPDRMIQLEIMTRLDKLFTDFFSFITNLDDFPPFPTFKEVFATNKFCDHIFLIKQELKTVLKEVKTTEQLSGVFIGLLGHEMAFEDRKDFTLLSYNEKEILMLNNLKLLDIAYQELYQVNVPLPEGYQNWLHENLFDWELSVRDLQ